MVIDLQTKKIVMFKKNNSLFWKTSTLFFILLTIVGCIYIYISFDYSNKYLDEVNQRLNHDTAKNIVENSTPFYDGKVIKPALEEMFHHVRAINPSLEVYLINPKGKIIAWYPPEREISLKYIDIKPIIEFINDKENKCIKGDDPLQPNAKKVFSASPLYMNNMLYAYIYVVLTGEKYKVASDSLFTSYMFKISARTMIITLLTTFLIGLIIIRVITKNYTKILSVMQKFRQGDLQARVEFTSRGEEKQLGEMFNEMADILTTNIDKLREVETLRKELVANVSHDLRTPIAIIKGYIETLQIKEETLTINERRCYINTVKESIEKLEKLISELFELSKLEANQVKAKKEPFIVSELISDIISKYRLLAKNRNINIAVELSKDLPAVYADIALIERVMQNLIDNAMKFTPNGGDIIIKTLKNNEYNAKIIVADTGIGIAETDKEKIFKRYYKTNNEKDFKEGTGLGLAIVKKILDLHNSSLELCSAENQGCVFEFKLCFYDFNKRN